MEERSTTRLDAQVVVVGGGLSGLVAARDLLDSGVETVVLEAKDRVGGRTLNQPLPGGEAVEGGGEWVYPYHEKIARLAEELGIETFPQFDEGERVSLLRGERRLYDEASSGLEEFAAVAFRQIWERLEGMCADVDPAKPWAHEEADSLDAQTLGGWLDAELRDPGARHVFDLSFGLQFGAPLDRVSLLFALTYVASFGGKGENVLPADRFRLLGGSQVLSLKLAEQLGSRLHLDTAVRAIKQGAGSGVEVIADGLTVHAERCIVALGPAECRAIEFHPQLPSRRRSLQDSWQCGAQIKAHAVYERPFWRHDGLSGFARSDIAAASLVLDNSPPDGSEAVLVSLFQPNPGPSPTGLDEAAADSPEARREAVLAGLVALFGEEASRPVTFFEQNWQEVPYTSGCQPFYPPGLLTSTRDAIRQPCGAIHWAATESATRCLGWMEGAVDAAQRAVKEVTDSL